jgi:hypothetical protein
MEWVHHLFGSSAQEYANSASSYSGRGAAFGWLAKVEDHRFFLDRTAFASSIPHVCNLASVSFALIRRKTHP